METLTLASAANDGGGSDTNDLGAVTSASDLEVSAGSNTASVSMVTVSIPDQPVQVQSVIQQQSVIQAAAAGSAIQTIQVTPIDEGEDLSESKKRREILARRPSYRRILNDLSSDPQVGGLNITKIEEESASELEDEDPDLTGNSAGSNSQVLHYQQQGTGIVKVLPAQIQIAGDNSNALQTLTMTNVNSTTASSTAGTTIVQYTQGPDGQIYIPGNVQAYQIATPTSLPGGVIMQGGLTSVPEEASRKRELRLLKNRDAARECRRKKKEYVKCLENRVAVLENQNKALIEELKSLKELYCQKEG